MRLAVHGLGLLIGRERTVRLGRCLEDEGRLDGPNDLRVNGERRLIGALVEGASPASGLVVFDIGANVGTWTYALAQEVARRPELDPSQVRVFAIEPALSSYNVLYELTRRLPLDIHVRRVALSDAKGQRPLYIVGETAGVNSFYPPHGTAALSSEAVDVRTLDEFTSAIGIQYIDLAKIDAEGEDMAVLEGARRLLRDRRIGLVQFEYNYRWISARRFLKDAFEMLSDCGYRLGKLTRSGWEGYPQWHPVLENYREANFLAIAAEERNPLPALDWWGRRLC